MPRTRHTVPGSYNPSGGWRVMRRAATMIAPEQSEMRGVVASSLNRLEAHLVQERLRGYDPYDALTSPLFRLPVSAPAAITRTVEVRLRDPLP